jgi:hypothetical protein
MLHYPLPFQLLPNNPTRYVRHNMALGFGRGRDGFRSRCGRFRGRGLGLAVDVTLSDMAAVVATTGP